MAIAEIEEKTQKNPGNLLGLVALAIVLAVVSVAVWQLYALLESARLGPRGHTIGRALSESNPELFAKELKEHRDAQAEYEREVAEKAEQKQVRLHVD